MGPSAFLADFYCDFHCPVPTPPRICAGIEANDLAYRAILQGGSSGHPRAHDIVETSRNEVVVRLAEAFDLGPLTPVLRIALRGWVGFLEAACLEWLATKPMPKADLARLLATSITRGPLRAADTTS